MKVLLVCDMVMLLVLHLIAPFFLILSGRKNICCYCSVTKSHSTLCDPMDCSMTGYPVLHYFLEFSQTRVYGIDIAIQPSHSLPLPSPPVLNFSQHQGLFQ